MFRATVNRIILACGGALLLLLIGGALAAEPDAVQAQSLPPRPTAAPTEAPATVVPTEASEEGSRRATPVPAGRITGTVIDQRTGAPAPGVAVSVGEALVSSDANGNYDLTGLTPGSYLVALRLDEGQGHAAQDEVVVALGAGQTVVQHLFFRSPEPPVAPAPTTLPAPQATPTPPSAPAVAVATPVALPATGASEAGWPAPLLTGLGLLSLGLAARRAARR